MAARDRNKRLRTMLSIDSTHQLSPTMTLNHPDHAETSPEPAGQLSSGNDSPPSIPASRHDSTCSANETKWSQFSREELIAELKQREQERIAQLNTLSADNSKKLHEIASLYRMSSTMLSTIRLNKLVHLILTALTTGENPFFDRAMLFLINERSATMRGMLGVSRETASGLIIPPEDTEELSTGHWDISEEAMLRQQASDFNRQVQASSLELDKSRNLASRAALEKRLIHVTDIAREKKSDREFVRSFGITTCALVPLMAKTQMVGVLIVDNSLQNAPITLDDLRFLQLVTNQAGMAIEKSILYNRLEDANRSLREARERLVQGERLATIGEMAAGIAHEVKGPLVSIGGFARRLKRKLSAGSVEYGHTETIVKEVERLEQLLTDILTFTKKTTICYATCAIRDIIVESLEIVAPTLEEHGIKVIAKYPAKTINLLGDERQLKQVFLNIFNNAQEAMGYRGELRITVSSTRLEGADAVSVKISDTGGGIPLTLLHSIFNSFFSTKVAGTGLGLPIANRIVANHGGKIQVNSKVGTGAEFNVIIPLSP
jgi:two-component system, NtrC family, sensor histidine kinase HydH